jgi:endonuclease G, mitochondrial
MFLIYFVVFSFSICISEQQLSFINNSPYTTLFKRQFLLFETWVDCRERLPILFYYRVEKDVGNFQRYSSFYLDPDVPTSCQQLTSNAYSGSGYDRGHMVTANHVDQSLQALKESNYMTNITPQRANMNRGAWLQTEEITECHRDLDTLNIYGGIIMGNDVTNDIFKYTHGIRTPDFNWKIIENTRTKDVIAWIIPNSDSATRSNLNQYATTILDIEAKSGFIFNNFSYSQKTIKQSNWQTNWAIPANCDFSRNL